MNLVELMEFVEPPVSIGFDTVPERALEAMRDKGLRTSFSYADLSAAEHASAFTVAKMLDADLLADVKTSLEEALKAGTPFKQWADSIIPTLQKKGWWGRESITDPATGKLVDAQLGSPHRLEVIFRTNMQSAYAVGQWEQIKSQEDIAPYLLYDAVDDHRTRPEHAAWDGTVLPIAHSWWRTHTPPNGWACRCGVIQLSEDELEALDLKVSGAPRDGTYRWKNPRTGKVETIPKGVDPGFDFNPGQRRFEEMQKLAAQKAASLPPDAAIAVREGLQATQRAIATAALVSVPLAGAGAGIEITLTRAAAREQAARADASAALVEYRLAILAGRVPSARAQRAFDALPDDAAKALTELLQLRLAQAVAETGAEAEILALVADPDSAAARVFVDMDLAGKTRVQILAELKDRVVAVANRNQSLRRS